MSAEQNIIGRVLPKNSFAIHRKTVASWKLRLVSTKKHRLWKRRIDRHHGCILVQIDVITLSQTYTVQQMVVECFREPIDKKPYVRQSESCSSHLHFNCPINSMSSKYSTAGIGYQIFGFKKWGCQVLHVFNYTYCNKVTEWFRTRNILESKKLFPLNLRCCSRR